MRTLKLFMLISVLFYSSLMGKNLQILKNIEPLNYEQIDVEIDGNLMIITGGLGGAVLYDISDPGNPISLSDLRLGGCPWGRTYSWDINDDASLAIGTSRECGIGIFDISQTSNPKRLISYRPSLDSHVPEASGFEVSVEDVEIVGDYAILAAHSDGILIYDISSPVSPQFVSQVATNNAFSLAVDNNFVYVADGDKGLKIIDISQISTPRLVSSLETSGSAKDIRYKNDYVFMAVGAAGVDVAEVSDPELPVLLDSFETRGFASKVAINNQGNLVSVSAWVDIEVLEWNGVNLNLVGYKNTAGRVMAVGMATEGIIYSAEWEDLIVYQYGSSQFSDIDIFPRFLDFSHLLDGQSETLSVEVESNGLIPLNISTIISNHEDFTFQPTVTSINPGESQVLQITYTANSQTAGGQLLLYSDDPDEGIATVKLSGNAINNIAVGQPAPNFELPVIANGKNTLGLSDFAGQVVVVAFFGWW